METEHTLYEWCLLNNIEILDLEEYHYDDYMLTKIDIDEYKILISEFEVKYDSTPTKPEKYLEWVNKIGGPKNVFLREFLKDK